LIHKEGSTVASVKATVRKGTIVARRDSGTSVCLAQLLRSASPEWAAHVASMVERDILLCQVPPHTSSQPPWCLLHFAAAAGHAVAAETLLACSDDPDVRTGSGETALFIALMRGHSHLFDLLLEVGARPDLVVRGETVWHAAPSLALLALLDDRVRYICPPQLHLSLNLSEFHPPLRSRAIGDFQAREVGQLTLGAGDVVAIHERQAGGWWLAEAGGETGLVPGSYVAVPDRIRDLVTADSLAFASLDSDAIYTAIADADWPTLIDLLGPTKGKLPPAILRRLPISRRAAVATALAEHAEARIAEAGASRIAEELEAAEREVAQTRARAREAEREAKRAQATAAEAAERLAELEAHSSDAQALCRWARGLQDAAAAEVLAYNTWVAKTRPGQSLEDWTVSDVLTLLEEVGLAVLYRDAFERGEVSGPVFGAASNNDLLSLGVADGRHRKLLLLIADAMTHGAGIVVGPGGALPTSSDFGPALRWSTREVQAWLADDVALPQYLDAFQAAGITGFELLYLTESELTAGLGVGILGHRFRLSREIAALRVATLPWVTEATGTPYYGTPGGSTMRPSSPGSASSSSPVPRRSRASTLTTELLAAGHTEDDPPSVFVDPISLEVIEDPVVAGDGFTYEKRTIALWFLSRDTSPVTGEVLTSKVLTPNHALRSQIAEWRERLREAEANQAGESTVARNEGDTDEAAVVGRRGGKARVMTPDTTGVGNDDDDEVSLGPLPAPPVRRRVTTGKARKKRGK